MNVFVLCTGRCGSVTFSRACSHITNFTAGHESRSKLPGPDRVTYPRQHIEVDNRLSWFLGRLEQRYGDNARYVHLTRDRKQVGGSFNRRWHLRTSIMRAYAEQICMVSPKDPLEICYDYVDTVTANINAFLRDKTHAMAFAMEDHADAFPAFWRWIGAEGNLDSARKEWAIAHNRS